MESSGRDMPPRAAEIPEYERRVREAVAEAVAERLDLSNLVPEETRQRIAETFSRAVTPYLGQAPVQEVTKSVTAQWAMHPSRDSLERADEFADQVWNEVGSELPAGTDPAEREAVRKRVTTDARFLWLEEVEPAGRTNAVAVLQLQSVEQHNKQLIRATWVLAVATIILAVATVALIFATAAA